MRAIAAQLWAARSGTFDRLSDYLELTKPRIAALVLVTVAIGGFVGSGGSLDAGILLHAVVGTALAAAGSSALNQWLETDTDRRMIRTADRPLPSGRLLPGEALAFGVVTAILGVAYLLALVGPVPAALAAGSALLYVGVYTPMKRWSALNTAVGAVPGALPPLIGWSACSGQLDAKAWSLFLLVYVWQFPHFFAIAWLYREEYSRAGLKMLPVSDWGKRTVGLQTVSYLIALLPVSLAPFAVGLAGPVYFAGAALLGLYFLAYGVSFALRPSDASARMLLFASLIYLPAVLGMLAIELA